MNAFIENSSTLWSGWAAALSWQIGLLAALVALITQPLSARFRYMLWLLIVIAGTGVINISCSPKSDEEQPQQPKTEYPQIVETFPTTGQTDVDPNLTRISHHSSWKRSPIMV